MTMIRLLGVLATLAIALPAAAQERVGVATTVVGAVTVTHVAASPAPLKFKDDVLLNDRVATGEEAFARMLLGGKAIVTARERSVITITEVPGVSTIDVVSGRISVAVDKSRMRPGEVVEIKTPNAVSGIRGTIVVAEVSDGISTITVLRGLVDVYRRDPATGRAVGQATPVAARESVTVKAGILPARPQSISADQARTLSNDFTAPVRPVAPAKTIVTDEVSRATLLVGALTGSPTANGGTQPIQGDATATKTDASTVTGALSTGTVVATTDKLVSTTPLAATALTALTPIAASPILATPISPILTSPPPITQSPVIRQPLNTLLKP